MDIDTSGLARFERVAEQIKKDIRAGAFGDVSNESTDRIKIPAHRKLADRYDVSLGTAQKAVRVLEDEGWLESRQAVGVFIRRPLPDIKSAQSVRGQLDQLTATTADLTKRLEQLERTVRDIQSV